MSNSESWRSTRHSHTNVVAGPASAITPTIGCDAHSALSETGSYSTEAWLAETTMFGLLNLKKEEETTARYVRELRIQPPSLRRLVIYLSGGNQQKVILSRWLSSDSKILIFDEPTRGIDVGAKAEVFLLMNHLAEQGVGIIMISSEMPELLAMADRILVMRAGSFTAEYERGEATQEKLLRSAT